MAQHKSHRLTYARGAALALLSGVIIFWLAYLAAIFLPFSLPNFLLFFAASAAAAALVGLVLAAIVRLAARLPLALLWALAVVLVLFLPVLLIEIPLALGLVAALLLFVALCTGLGLAITAALKRRAARPQLVFALVALAPVAVLAGAVGWLSSPGQPPRRVESAVTGVPSPLAALSEDPTAPGPFQVNVLRYGAAGAGTGPGRSDASGPIPPALVTQPLDGRAWVKQWSSARTRFFGFGPGALPLNGRVWRPAGAGPFPLVLVLHGNHAMEQHSDGGYAYLCQVLASRGSICATVDENFLNAATWTGGAYLFDPGAGVDARAWLLLEHLKVWRGWNREPDHPLHSLIDESRIALIGHSVGGEAVAVAATLNRLSAYPDDASRAFDYRFGIRSVVALAPTDSLQWLGGRRVKLENVDYLALHGSLDMDVLAFQGQSQLERLSWTDGGDHLAAAVYIHGANHGQFNTAWGRRDKGDLAFALMNTEQIMPGEKQRQITLAYVSAFLEASLNGKSEYRNLLRDARTSAAVPPDEIILSQMHESRVQYLATYEEDVDVASATLQGGRIAGENLAMWREGLMPLKLDSVNTAVAFLGWDQKAAAGAPSYRIDLPAAFAAPQTGTLVFALAHRVGVSSARKQVEPVDLTIRLTDAAGASASLPLHHFAYLQPELHIQLARAPWMTATVPPSQPVFQTFSLPLADFRHANPAFDAAQLRSIRLVFDRTPAGLVLLDEVGIRP